MRVGGAALLSLLAACRAPAALGGGAEPKEARNAASAEAHVSAGVHDLGFGNDGVADVTALVGKGPVTAAGVAADARGRIYGVFRVDPSASDSHAVIVALDASGRPDRAFGKDGALVFSDPNAVKTFPYGVVIEPERLVVYGNVQIASSYQGALWGLTPSGQLDAAFGRAGVVHMFYDARGATGATEVWTAALTPDGRWLLAGGREGEGGWVDRFTASGAPDDTFHDGMFVAIPAPAGGVARVHAIAPAAGGTFYAAVHLAGEGAAREALHAFDPFGNAADLSGEGLAGGASPEPSDLRSGLFVERAGRLVTARCDANAELVVQRLGASGAPDATYAPPLPTRLSPCRFGDLVATRDGGALVAGFAAGSRTAVMMRLAPDGALDARFGHAGLVAFAAPDPLASVRVAEEADGKVLAASTTVSGAVSVRRFGDGDRTP